MSQIGGRAIKRRKFEGPKKIQVKAVKQSLTAGDEVEIVDTTFAETTKAEYKASNAIAANSRVLEFDVQSRYNCVYNPSEVTLQLCLKIVQNDGNPFPDPVNTDSTVGGQTNQCRFVNDLASHIIKEIRVHPNYLNNVESQTEWIGLMEKIRTIFPFGKEERENRTMFYERLFHPKLMDGSCVDAVGIGLQEGVTGLNTEAKKATYELEKYVHSTGNNIIRIRPMPATFFEHANFLSGLVSFKLQVTLANDATVLLSTGIAYWTYWYGHC